MASKGGYRKISGDEDKKVSFLSSLFFLWMNGVLKEGSQRPLDQNDFLPLSDENSGRFATDKLQKIWECEKYDCKMNGKRPRLWKSVFDMLSVKDVIIILTGNILSTTSRLLFPLFLGYLVSKLMSTEAENTYRLYACALAMCLNGLIGGLGMHQQDYRCEILGIKIASALRGLAYHKVGTILRLNRFLYYPKNPKLSRTNLNTFIYPIKNYFFLEILSILIALCHMETRKERVIKHHRQLLLLRE